MGGIKLRLPGLLPRGLAGLVGPYRSPRHQTWVDELLARSDATAKRLATREALLLARRARQHTVRLRPMGKIFEVMDDGSVREVPEPTKPPSPVAEFGAGPALGTLGSLAALAWLKWASLPADRRRRRR